MIQENGMPMEFELIDKKTGEIASNDLWRIDFVTGKLVYNEFFYVLRQAIGATDLSDPKQELYFGDVIEIDCGNGKRGVGEIIWDCFRVCVKHNRWRGEPMQVWPFCDFSNQNIKKLGSRYDPKMKEILKKAGLEKTKTK